MQAYTKTHHFEISNAKIFWGGDTPSPDTIPLGAIRHLDLRAYTALKLNVTPPEKNSSYGLGIGRVCKFLSISLNCVFIVYCF